MTFWFSRPLFLVGWLAALEGAVDPDEYIARIRGAYEFANSAIHSIEYQADCTGRTAVTPEGVSRAWWLNVAIAGQNRYAEIAHHFPGLPYRLDPNRCQTILTNNGLEEFWTNRRIHIRYGSLPDSRIPSMSRVRTEFIFESTGLWPKSCRLIDEVNVSAMHALLNQDNWQICTAETQGMECITLVNESHALWLAPEMGFSVLRRISKLKDSQNLSVIYENGNFEQHCQGVWIPRSMSRTIARNVQSDNLSGNVVVHTEDIWSHFNQSLSTIRVNSVEQQRFSFNLLPGTICVESGASLVSILPGGLDMLDDVCRVVTASASPTKQPTPIDWRFLSLNLLWGAAGAILVLAIGRWFLR